MLDRLAGHEALVHLEGILGGDGGGVREGHTQGLDGGGHGVGGVHAAAGTRAGAGLADDVAAGLLVDGAGDVLAVGLESGDDIEGFTLGGGTGLDGTAVDHDGRAVEAAHRDDAPGHVLVAAGE